ncbi:Calpain catalytic domain-containing protein [Fusarium sp. LHS14.1]|nr:Calpain catalytic domain-containing protein [Fusarium sp. LHS14.1]
MKTLSPQDSIDRTWTKFFSCYSGKPLVVLPYGCVSLGAADHGQSNELLSDAYERTAEECRRIVQKRAEECRRADKRYEDSHWDLERDLKQKEGHCLNSLGSQRFKFDEDTLLWNTIDHCTIRKKCKAPSHRHRDNLASYVAPQLPSPSALTPRSVKRVPEIFDNPTFMKNVNGSDVRQGTLSNAWLVGALTALGNVPDSLKRICVAYDTEVGIYGLVFFRDGGWIQTIIDDKLYLKSADWNHPNIQRYLLEQISRVHNENVYRKTYQTGSQALFFAQCRDQNETWVPLIEKAYAKAHGDYASLSDGWMSEGLEDLSGNVFTGLRMSSILNRDRFWDKMSRANDEFFFSASTDCLGGSYVRPDGILEAHSYVVMDARMLESGERLVKLRGPRGKGGQGTWKGPWCDGSKEWTIQVLEELGHTPGSDSVFWMSYEDFMRTFADLDRMRSFSDPDWRCCQRWIAVDKLWKEEYSKRFRFKLTKKSSLFLVLSQLDRRYYVGLWGRYSFHLDFRLHKEDSPDAEGYVARPHDHYAMGRSASVDLSELPAGNYVVHLKVTCERDVKTCSVEEVVERECLNRDQNEKFIQVGLSHDLAQSKAKSYVNELIKRRGEKASEDRQKQRRLAWELGSVRRHASKKQREKNMKKKQMRREAWEAEQAHLGEEYNAKMKVERAKMEKRPAKAETEVSQAVEEADGESEGEAFNGAETKPGADKDVLDSIEVSRDFENLKAETAGAVSISTSSPHLTPKPVESVDRATRNKQEVRPIDGATPGLFEEEDPLPVRARPANNSADESSDSPVEDWEVVHLANERVSKPHGNLYKQAAVQSDDETEEEGAPDPWNAVCVVGIRVYSKDSGLELHTMMEGDELI